MFGMVTFMLFHHNFLKREGTKRNLRDMTTKWGRHLEPNSNTDGKESTFETAEEIGI